jgi:hypothetical protein
LDKKTVALSSLSLVSTISLQSTPTIHQWWNWQSLQPEHHHEDTKNKLRGKTKQNKIHGQYVNLHQIMSLEHDQHVHLSHDKPLFTVNPTFLLFFLLLILSFLSCSWKTTSHPRDLCLQHKGYVRGWSESRSLNQDTTRTLDFDLHIPNLKYNKEFKKIN